MQTKLNYARAMEAHMAYTWVEDRMSPQHRQFHSQNLAFVPVTTLDGEGRPWGSLLSNMGERGFIASPDDTVLIVDAVINDGDPIIDNIQHGANLIAGLGIELTTRRRNKFAGKIGTIARTGETLKLTLNIDQALGNCPKYINVRTLEPHPATAKLAQSHLHLGKDENLPSHLIELIHHSDTTFLGTSYIASPNEIMRNPSHLGMNHRGGQPGFVRVLEGRTCIIPDYSGNRMMQSLGNIDATPLASLTFVDWVNGHILYLTGEAENYVGPEARAIMPRANALTAITVTGYVYVEHALPLRQRPNTGVSPSPYSPPVWFLANETEGAQKSLNGITAALEKIVLHAPTIATFFFKSSQPITIQPGQHAILDLTSLVGSKGYQHMAHEGLEATLNDDNIRTWTVSSSHSSATQEFRLTMKEKPGGAITGKLFAIARALAERRPELLSDMTPLGISLDIVGVGGTFVLPKAPGKLLLVAGGVGITPFLSMLSEVTSTEGSEGWDVVLVVSTREPQVFADLVRDALGPRASQLSLHIHIFSSAPIPSSSSSISDFHQGRPDEQFFDKIEDINSRDVFVCGPLPFEEMILRAMRGKGAHYPPATYNYTFNPQAPAAARSGNATTITPATAAPAAAAAAAPNGGVDTSDLATLNDALGNAGIDLRAEEEGLHQSYEAHQTYRNYEDRSRKQPATPSFDTRFLGPTMRNIGTQHKVRSIPEDSVNYLALALRTRLQDLVTQMVAAARHRTDTQFDRAASFYEDGVTPMWSINIRSDVARQLAALEKAEREDETRIRKERKERAEAAANLARDLAGTGGEGSLDGMDDGEGGAKKKRKKEGPGVTARNMSEDVRKKMSNAVASQAAGLGGKYAWMNAANAGAGTPKAKAAPKIETSTPAAGPSTAGAATPTTTTTPASGWSRPYLATKKSFGPTTTAGESDTRLPVTLRDAMFVIEKERGHGGGRGAARGWI
ncbi:hypothetical protein HWV62_31579 [Athelia sp. TMB]|nr:hypothetical protein HWV62_31579 [Athelia sp. TMB]